MIARAEQPPGDARRVAVLVALMSMLAPFSIDMYLPSFPQIAREFGSSQVQMQQTLSLYLLAFALTTLVYGPLADAFGRRVVVLWAIGLYAVASLGCAFSGSTGGLLAFRVGQGLTASAGFIVGRATVRDVFTGARAQKVMSNIMLLFALAPAVAPILGGYLHDALGWRAVFVFLALLGGGLWLLVYFSLPETLAPPDRHSIHPIAVGRIYGSTLARGGFMALVFMIGLNFGGMFLYVSGAPVLIYEHLGLGADDFAILFVPLVSGIMLGSFTSARLAGRVEILSLISLGYACMAGAVLLNLWQAWWLPGHAALVVAPLGIYAFGNALAVPSLVVLALDYFPRNRGMASATQGFVHTGSNALVAGALVPVVSHAITSMVLGMTCLYVISLALWLVWLRAGARSLDPCPEGR